MRWMMFLLGSVMGAGAALMLAPRTGEQVRRDLRGRVDERYGHAIERGRIRATELIKTGRETLDEQLARGQDAVNTAIETARTRIDAAREDAAAPPPLDPHHESNATTHQQF